MSTIAVTECDDGSRLRAHVGDTIEVRLSENATAGFRWALDGRPELPVFGPCEEGAEYPCKAVGSGGEAIFRLTVRGAGNAALRFKYWRHWEGESSVCKRFAVDVHAAS